MTTDKTVEELVLEVEKLTQERDELLDRLNAARTRMKGLEAAVERLQSNLSKCKHGA